MVRLDDQNLSAISTDEETKEELSGGVTSFPIRAETTKGIGVPFIKTGFAPLVRVRRSTSIPTPTPQPVVNISSSSSSSSTTTPPHTTTDDDHDHRIDLDGGKDGGWEEGEDGCEEGE